MRKMPLALLVSAARADIMTLPTTLNVEHAALAKKTTSPALTTAAALRKTVKTPLDFLLRVLLSPNVVVVP